MSSKSVAVFRVRLSQQSPCKASTTSSSGLSPQGTEVVLPFVEGHQVTGSGVCVCSAGTFHSPEHPVCVRGHKPSEHKQLQLFLECPESNIPMEPLDAELG